MALEGSRRRRIAVVCDSSVPLDAARSHGLLLPDAVVSLPILIEGERLDGRLSQAELGAQVAMAQASRLRVSTSRPTPEAFSTAFRDLEAQGYAGIVVVVISGRISGTLEPALTAAEGAGVPVAVVDSRTSGWAMGRCVHAYRELAETDALEELAECAPGRVPEDSPVLQSLLRVRDELLEHWHCAVVLSNLDALKAGGRAPAGAAGLVKAFGVRPVVVFKDGGFGGLEIARNQAGAVDRALKSLGWTRKNPAPFDGPLVVESYGVKNEKATELLEAAGFTEPAVFSPVSLVLAVHLGPGCLALSGWGRPEALTQQPGDEAAVSD